MFQTGIDEYKKLVDVNLPQYLASMPSPFDSIEDYLSSEEYKDFTTEMFDVAGITALIRSHKDSKDKYDVNAYLVEMLTSMFRVANRKLGWLEDEDVQALTSMLATDSNSEHGKDAFVQFYCCAKMFPYNIEQQKWYAYLMPIFAYSKQHKFTVGNYLARYMVNIINRYNLTFNIGEHDRDIQVDQLRCIPTLAGLLKLCAIDNTKKTNEEKYWFRRNVIIEFARIYLGCLFQRSAVIDDFGKIGAEVTAYHYVLYQEICQAYFKQKQAKE